MALPIPSSAYRLEAAPDYRVVDPTTANAMIGLELSGGLETLTGSNQPDLIFAGDDPNVPDEQLPPVSPESDRLNGLAGDDWLVGDRLNNVFDGGSGNDRQEGRRGDDVFLWSSGSDWIDGEDGFDQATYAADPFPADTPGARGSDLTLRTDAAGHYLVSYRRLEGAFQSPPFTDTLVNVEEVVGSIGNDNFTGGPLPDRFLGWFGDDHLSGGSGGDFLDGGPGDDRLDGGPGDDTLIGGPDSDELDGGPGSDVLTGDEQDTLLAGGEGDDRISGGGTILGGAGNDTVQVEGGGAVDGGEGNDHILGSTGADSLDGGPGSDVVEAGLGDDLGIFRLGDSGSLFDRYDGGGGMDTFRVVVPDLLGVMPAQIADLARLQAEIATPSVYSALLLDLAGWERVEIVDRFGAPVDLASLVQQPPTEILLSNLSGTGGDPRGLDRRVDRRRPQQRRWRHAHVRPQ